MIFEDEKRPSGIKIKKISMAKIKELLKILEILNDLIWDFHDNFLHIDCSISMIFKKWLVEIINKIWVKALV